MRDFDLLFLNFSILLFFIVYMKFRGCLAIWEWRWKTESGISSTDINGTSRRQGVWQLQAESGVPTRHRVGNNCINYESSTSSLGEVGDW